MSALILLSVLGLVLMFMGLRGMRGLLIPVAVIGLAGAFAMLATGWKMEWPVLTDGMMAFDAYTLGFGRALVVLTILLFLFAIDYYARVQANVAEILALMIFSLVGALVMTGFTNLLMLFIGVEVMSIPVYILAGGKRDSLRSGEASIKYFLQGSFASGFFLLGIALIYGSCASFDLAAVQAHAAGAGADDRLFLLGLFFTISGVAFKVAAVPFHFWSPDVYEGSPTLITAFMNTVVKTAAFAAFYRLIEHMQLPYAVHTMLLLMTACTLLLGNLVALRQTHFKRLLAYSGIAHTGFLMLALLSPGPNTPDVLYYYLITYALATVGLFVMLTVTKRASRGDEHIRSFRGMFRSAPWVAIVTMMLLLSLAGIPLTAGFLAKYRVFMLSLEAGYLWITALAVLMALVGIYYYLIVIREAFTPKADAAPLHVSPVNWLLISVCGVAAVLFAVMPQWLAL